MNFEILPVPCLTDNYAYLVVCSSTGEAAVVDPSEGTPVVRAAAAAGLRPVAVWNTHHHPDHTGGNEAIAEHFGIEWVSGHASDRGRIAGQTRFLDDGERFALGKLAVRVVHIPGHTRGAVAYVVRDDAGNAVAFTGDTMFHGGCGRLFEGTPADMHSSLQRIVALGDDVLVFPGHEYTVANLRFAASVEPSNAAVATALREALALRNQGKPTVGTTIARERATNPFLRTREPEIRANTGVAEAADDATALGAVREAKNAFR